MTRRLFGVLGLVAVLTAPSGATTLLPVDLPALTDRAATIFVGRVVAVRTGIDPHGLPATWTTFAVDEQLKGTREDQRTVKQLGTSAPVAADGRLIRVAALPTYRVGEEVLLFLHAESGAGFTSPVGFGQGCFRIRDDGTTRLATNDVANANLAPVPAPGGARRAPGSAATPALPLDDLIGQVRTLAAGP